MPRNTTRIDTPKIAIAFCPTGSHPPQIQLVVDVEFRADNTSLNVHGTPPAIIAERQTMHLEMRQE